MNIRITLLDQSEIRRRTQDGQIFDIIDYPFEVSKDQVSRRVKVGITGTFHDPADALGLKNLSQTDLAEAAAAWLRSRLEKGECDPFARPQTDTVLTVPSSVMDYWVEHREIPSQL